MSRSKPKRRWLQFSLRSVLLVTLAVALWLGYEVHQARQVERTIAGIAALGGNTECELTGWSLLRLCRVPGYGRRLVRVDIPGSVAEEAIDLLRDSPGLREVEVTYDGTYDPAPSWKMLLDELPNTTVLPTTAETTECEERLRSKALGAYPTAELLFGRSLLFKTIVTDSPGYRVVRLPNGSLAEILSGRRPWFNQNGATDLEIWFAILVVNDRCLDSRGFFVPFRRAPQLVLEDADGDGAPELGFQWTEKIVDQRLRQLPGDSRQWLGVYKIEHDGFKSVLPVEHSFLPNALDPPDPPNEQSRGP